MNVSLPAAAQQTRFRLHREVRIFLIHVAIWMAWDALQSYAILHWLPVDPKRVEYGMVFKYKDQFGYYLWISLITNVIYLLTVHGLYAVYQRLFRRESIGRIILFIGIVLVYFVLLAGLTGFVHGYLDIRYEKMTAVAGVAILFTYALLFVVVRGYRHGRRERRELERQKTEAELAALKAQVNPHFLFNTLNNLYGTALTGDTDRTAAGIEQLSGVMRHVVEESRRDRTPIAKEIRFLDDTVELHRMRLPQLDTILVRSVITWDEQPTPDGRPVEVAPLLLVSFIENAFKYGISIHHTCFVDIRLTVERGQLSFRCRNSILSNNRLEASTGTGIGNVRQRLNLLYPNRHTLRVGEEAGAFAVDLDVTL